jgi:hypothetical protein
MRSRGSRFLVGGRRRCCGCVFWRCPRSGWRRRVSWFVDRLFRNEGEIKKRDLYLKVVKVLKYAHVAASAQSETTQNNKESYGKQPRQTIKSPSTKKNKSRSTKPSQLQKKSTKEKKLTRICLSSAPVAKYFPSGLKHTLRIYRSPDLPADSSVRTLCVGWCCVLVLRLVGSRVESSRVKLS